LIIIYKCFYYPGFSEVYNMGSVYEKICNRRTVRRYQIKVIPLEILIKLVNAARLAPSGANLQPCRYIIVNEQSQVDCLFPCLKWAGYIAPEGDPPVGERPVSYIVVLIDEALKKKGGEVDAAAGIMNIILAACEDGIGSCWLGSINRKEIKNILRIPHHIKVNSVIAFGYPKEQPVVEELKDSIKYWKDKRGTLHVPKRNLEDICYKNIYGKDIIELDTGKIT
jgi:nitroreductase